MSKKRKTYSADFKAKLVLEVLEGNKTLNEIASQYEVLPKSLIDWKKQFLANASLAFDKSAVVKEYKDEIEKLEKQSGELAKKVGTLTIERDWLEGKLVSLDLSTRKEMVDSEGVQATIKEKHPSQKSNTSKSLSLNRQLELLHISKTAHYYKPLEPFGRDEDKKLLDMIDKIHTKHPYYGTRRIVKLLKRLGFDAGRKLIKSAFEFMGIRALYPMPKTTIANKEHKKYPYLLNAFKNKENQVIIEKPNQVWSGDITYIKLEYGHAYLAAIIDWHTKKILSWKLSNTMDVHLTTSVLIDAITIHGKPEIFNSDQGSQYTAKEHIEILTQNSISISMDAKGRSIDNIVMERFWRTLKYEDVYPKSYSTIKEAREGIKEYIDIYNKERLHSSLDYKTPDEVYYEGVNNRSYDAKKVWLEVA
jgi:putative transposase